MASLSNYFFWTESGYFDSSSEFKPLLHFWSLTVEEQYYFVWPATLICLLWLKKVKFIIISLVIIGLFSTILSENFLLSEPSAVFFLTPFRSAEFIIGGLCAFVSVKLKNWQSEILLLSGLFLIFYCIFNFDENTIFPGINAIIPSIGAALVILSDSTLYGGFILRLKPIVYIGLISYSLYLIHWPLIVYYKY